MGNQDFSKDSLREAMKLAQTPSGRQLIQFLQANGGEELRKAMAQAAAGDYTGAQKAISVLMENPQAKKLFEQMGGEK